LTVLSNFLTVFHAQHPYFLAAAAVVAAAVEACAPSEFVRIVVYDAPDAVRTVPPPSELA
jgi:hypothetical protein